jgi:hypothetical protein
MLVASFAINCWGEAWEDRENEEKERAGKRRARVVEAKEKGVEMLDMVVVGRV